MKNYNLRKNITFAGFFNPLQPLGFLMFLGGIE